MAYDKKQELPFATINLHLMKMIIARDPRRNMTIQITSSQVNGSYFEIQDEFVLIERKMLGTLDNINKFSIKDIPREQVVEEILTSTNNFARTIAETHQGSRGKEQLNVNIQMTPSRDKVIRIALDELKIYLITGIYLQLVEFVRMDPSVYPAPVEVIQPGQSNQKF